MRILSLLPAATEIVAVLGCTDALVGISHECDFPPEVTRLPRVTHCAIHHAGLSGAAIEDWVQERVASGGDLYTLDAGLVRELRPDVVLTQRLCEVCAISGTTVARVLGTLEHPPQLVELAPQCLSDILADIRAVARVLGVPGRGEERVRELEARVAAVRDRSAAAPERPVCFLMEWIDPPYCSGHWAPELVELAGGRDPLGLPGVDSTRILWERVVEARPEVLVAACCGWSVERTLEDFPLLRSYPGWETLPAVRSGRVYAVDGSAYFSRHGPRIVDSLEILAEILHPELFPWHNRGGAVRRVPAPLLAPAAAGSSGSSGGPAESSP